MSAQEPERRGQLLLNHSDHQSTFSGSQLSQSNEANGRVLPKVGEPFNYHKQEGKWEQIKKSKPVKIGLAIMCLIILIVIIVVATKHKPGPAPVPPGPTPDPPTPFYWNPYQVDNFFTWQEERLYGSLKLNSQVKGTLGDMPQAAPRSIPTGTNNKMAQAASFEFGQIDRKISRMILQPLLDSERFDPSSDVLNQPEINKMMKIQMSGLNVTSSPFAFSYHDSDRSNPYLWTNASTLVMMDKYMQLDLQTIAGRAFGLGERSTENFELRDGAYTMWANGDVPIQNNKSLDNQGYDNSYGVHPFMMLCQKQNPHPAMKDYECFGLYLRNANAMTVITSYNESTYTRNISLIATGGLFELYLIQPGSPKDVIKMYHSLIGKPRLPPIWSLGMLWSGKNFNQSEIENIINIFNTSKVPFETLIVEQNYFKTDKNFLVNTTSFPKLTNIEDGLYQNNQQMVASLDMGVLINDVDQYYNTAVNHSFFIKSAIHTDTNDGVLTNLRNNQQVGYFDFYQQSEWHLWSSIMKDVWIQTWADGLQLTGNAPKGDCDGEVSASCSSKSANNDQLGATADKGWYQSYPDQNTISTFQLPFIPGKTNLDKKTLSLNGTHPLSGQTQYNTHSLMGHLMSKATFEGYKLIQEEAAYRKFIMSDSTFAGSGQYVAHEVNKGYKFNTESGGYFQEIRLAIVGVANFQLFGLPLTGPSVCNQMGKDPNQNYDELCGCWMWLYPFLPLAKFDQNYPNKPQLYNLSEPHKTHAQNGITQKLQLSRLLYTCLFEVSQDGGTCLDPVWFHYPNGTQHIDIVKQFVYANSIMVRPIIDTNPNIRLELPTQGESYVDVFNSSNIIRQNTSFDYGNLNGPLAFQMPGTVIPFLSSDAVQNNTHQMNVNGKLDIMINRNKDGFAQGKVFLDSGDQLQELSDQTYQYFTIQHSGKAIKRWNINTANPKQQKGINSFVILDASDLNDVDFSCVWARDNSIVQLDKKYDGDTKTLKLYKEGSTLNSLEVETVYYGTKSKDINMCDLDTQFYRMQTPPDLTSYYASVVLTNPSSAFPDVKLELSALKGNIINLKWNFDNSTLAAGQFKVPNDIVQPLEFDHSAKLSDSVVIEKTGSSFKIKVKNHNPTGGNEIFELNGFLLTPNFQFVDYNALVEGSNYKGVMGLSDQVRENLFLQDGTYTLWNKYQNSPVSDGQLPGKNLYASNPIIMGRSSDKRWFMVYHNQAGPSDWQILNSPSTNQTHVGVYSVGGIGDIYIMDGQKPGNVISSYQTIIGNPVLLPQWAFGWHQCKYGYNNTQQLSDSLQKYIDFELPIDAQWVDIDLMDNFKDFTVDPKRFSDIQEFINKNKKDKGIRFVPIVDAGIAVDPTYKPYVDGLAQKAFIMNPASSVEEGPVIGQVWPGDVVFPDFFSGAIDNFWSHQLATYRSSVNFDGIWLEMNEIENFCDGHCYDFMQTPDSPKTIQDILPYIPGGRSLNEKTLTVDAMHSNNFRTLDTHNLYATMQTKSTFNYFEKNGMQERGFVVSRAGSQGIGKYGARQLGNNFSTFQYLASSIISIFQQSIAGVPMSGADICGFFGNTTQDLCALWYSVGAYYPFSRNHNNIGNRGQEPWQFSGQHLTVIRQSMRNKLSLLRYYHTSMLQLHVNGGSFFNPLFFEFPEDEITYDHQTYNVMLGSRLKLSANTDGLSSTTNFYFPAGTWCTILSSDSALRHSCFNSTGQVISKPSLLGEVWVDMIWGTILPFQNVTALAESQENVLNTKHLDYQKLDLVSLLRCQVICQADGFYTNDQDDWNSLDGHMNNVTFSLVSASPAGKTELTWTFTTIVSIGLINAADELGKLQVLNAMHVMPELKNAQTLQYTAVAKFKNQTTVDINPQGNSISYNVYDDLLTAQIPQTILLIDLAEIKIAVA